MLNEKTNNAFQEALKKYLDDFAKKDEHFASRYALETKTLAECEKYIMGEVKSMTTGSSAVMSDDDVYQMARHYYLEDKIKIKPSRGTSTPSSPEENKEKNKVKLTSEEMKKVKKEAEEEYKKQCIEEIKAKEQKKKQNQLAKQKKQDEELGQFSLFDFGD